MNKLLKRILTVGASLALAAAVAVPAMAAETPVMQAPKAEISVEKILDSLGTGTFPDEASYSFKLTSLSVTPGRTLTPPLTAKTMPMPAGSTVTETAQEKVLTVNKGIPTAEKPNEWTRTESFDAITYTEAGIYTYTRQVVVPATKVPGVGYDTTHYFVNVYVENVVDEHNNIVFTADGTKPKVTVSNITLYAGATNGQVADMTKPDEVGEGINKVNIGDPDGTDTVKITAPFTNEYPTQILTVSKVVTGNAADPNKEFEFKFDITALATGAPTSYSYQVYTMAGTTPAPTDMVSANAVADKNGTLASGDTFTLAHKQFIVIYGLLKDTQYKVTESGSTTADGYAASWKKLNGTGEATSSTGTDIREATGTMSGDTDAKNYVDFTNSREAATPTGVLLRVAPFALLAILLVVGIAFVVINSNKRRKNGYQGL